MLQVGEVPRVLLDDQGTSTSSPVDVAHLKLTGQIRLPAGAQVASGGVDTDEIDPVSCASTRIQGLYICGEMLDIDGTCGGWNLQFAWSTGTLAGMAAGEYVCSD